jgi:ATP-dependent Lon protease
VARDASVRLIDESMTGSRLIAVFTQRDATVEEPSEDDLYRIGTATHIHKMFKLPDGSLRLIVQGLGRVRLKRLTAMGIAPPEVNAVRRAPRRPRTRE